MKSIEILAYVMIFSFIKSIRARTPYVEGKFEVELVDDPNKTPDPNNPTNPVALEVERNGLYLTKTLGVFSSPNFIGEAPPGVQEFMVSQALTSSKNNSVQYGFLRGAAKRFTKSNKLIIDEKCSQKKGSSSCKPGYVKVDTKKGSSGCDITGSSRYGSSNSTNSSITPETKEMPATTLATGSADATSKPSSSALAGDAYLEDKSRD